MSGGTRESALIKTHHNRVPELLRRIEAGEVVEPLVQFYKDEVREIGRALGLYQPGEPAGFIVATLGAILLLFIYRKAFKPA